MHLQRLLLTQFKNYEKESIEFSSQLNCIVGNNGMGKTNLLDAVNFLCMTRSFFTNNDRTVIQQGTDFFRLEGHFTLDKTIEKIVAKVIPGKQKTFERNDVAYDKLSEHIGLLPIVMIAPDDTSLVTEGSELRRKFLDNTLSQQDSDYLKNLIVYNKILKSRNASLKQFQETRNFDYSLLNTYNQQMLSPAAVIHTKRMRFMEQFYPVFQAYHRIISGGNEDVNCVYESQLSKMTMLELLEQNIEKDRILQRTTAGIHKDDLIFTIADYPLKKFASQGQLKSFVLALKLAQYEFLRRLKKIKPILLLDDVFDKLDRERVQQLLSLLFKEEFGQIFITDTDEERVEEIIQQFNIPFSKFVIQEGKVISTKLN